MPVIKSAKKKLRADRKRQSANKKIEALVSVSIKKAQRKPTPKNIQEAFSLIDKGVKKNIIHKNKAARIKSRIAKLINEAPRSKLRGIKAEFLRSQQPHFAKASLGVPPAPSSSEQALRFSAKGNKKPPTETKTAKKSAK